MKGKSSPDTGKTLLKAAFRRKLLHWNQNSNQRQMPWKGEKDPYRIWLSEVILQQTRVEQGLKYYERFLQHFGDVQALAHAPDTAVFKLWEGLGYYSRCRNLISTARWIAFERNGVFPQTYAEILSMKGVGSYTAAAIAAFAYNLPYAVVDGNVQRVLARVFALETAPDSTEGKKLFAGLAQEILPKKQAGLYNQAIMDFGATVCRPVPDCAACSLNSICLAFRMGMQHQLPRKKKSIAIRERYFYYICVEYQGRLLVRERDGRDIWKHLHEFPLIESSEPLTASQLSRKFSSWAGKEVKWKEPFYKGSQKLTHQLLHMEIHVYQPKRALPIEGYVSMPLNAVHQLAFPKTLAGFIREYCI